LSLYWIKNETDPLPGFLVSGLLFKEYIKFGNIRPKLFLIRRGFKIYPIYFLFYIPYLLLVTRNENLNVVGLFADLTFTQNYFWGWGYAYGASWSLAVEEHFYFGFAICLWLGLKYNKFILHAEENGLFSKIRFEIVIIALLLIVFLLRLHSNIVFPQEEIRNFTMTHLRIDSLLFGVLISYLYYFRNDYLKKIFTSSQYLLYAICILGVVWLPFIDPSHSFFVKTFGFSLLYVSFGILLIAFLLKSNINKRLDSIFSARVVTIVSKIGYCSYSIYIIHTFILVSSELILAHFGLVINKYLFFLIVSTLSVTIGMFMTYKIEKYFLKVRDQYYPSRV
jgi:peptidoglycan/LPS O-acetylase OafA/YrhL